MRRCARCDTALAGDNRSPICRPCQRAARTTAGTPPLVPLDFWDNERLRNALVRDRDFGQVIRWYRHHPHHGPRPIPQTVIAKWLNISQVHLGRIERGDQQVTNLTQLTAWVRILRVPPHLLWFSLPSEAGGSAVTPTPITPSSSNGRDGIGALLENLSPSSAIPTISAVRHIQEGYAQADCLTGALSIKDGVSAQAPIVERACEVSKGADRVAVLEISSVYMEFCGWIHQDAGDLHNAMYWTDRAYDYAMQLGDQRTMSYTLMRKAAIAAEAGSPTHALGIANFALGSPAQLTPRLRAAILRQRAHANAALGNVMETFRDSENALAEALEGVNQGEGDRAPYCSPMYIAMETGHSMAVAGQVKKALPVLSRSHSDWSDQGQARDHALCVSRLATTYAAVNEPEQACEVAEEAISLAAGVGSARVIQELRRLSNNLAKWPDLETSSTREAINRMTGIFPWAGLDKERF